MKRLGPVAGLLLACLLACEATAGDIEDYSRIEKLYGEGKFEEALESANRFMVTYPKSPLFPEALYLAGRLTRNVAVALDNFSKIIVKYPESSVVDNALFMIGQYHYALGSYDQALLRFRFLAENYKASEILDGCYWWLSRCCWAVGDTLMSRVWEGKLVQKYPASEYARLAGRGGRGTPLSESQGFTVQVGSFSKKDAAMALRESLARKGYDAYVTLSESPGKSLYKVKVGSFPTREEAAREAEALKKSEGLNGWVTSKTE